MKDSMRGYGLPVPKRVQRPLCGAIRVVLCLTTNTELHILTFCRAMEHGAWAKAADGATSV
jgi:hypothetical protein